MRPDKRELGETRPTTLNLGKSINQKHRDFNCLSVIALFIRLELLVWVLGVSS